ncbi:heat-inducible transcription repressor HrcA [Mycoplasmopsis mustelae]|uniref:Heat-inducible transcription repressor HrcA n=1 Tax=Mycoplasmopsis mustelae TaxID=171289 RepID=A0A4R7UDF7_9BACT|nr:heat-inducible transcriptional repressor HrcA [Mycoplasmopsis mustelae]TDV24469.1 heat-inducible transcription repressor HrcA [Mycoplasmopsis mustelae]
MLKDELKPGHETVLKYTILLYIESAEAISSLNLLKKYPEIKFSSAKVRYLMNDLEQRGFLIKPHSSSGRIPTSKGLNYYANFLSETFEEKMLQKLETILNKKRDQIDSTLDQAAKVISDITNLTLVTTDLETNYLLKSIEMVPLSSNSATIVMVISSGEVFSKIIKFEEGVGLKDLRIAIKIFKDRLIDVAINQLANFVLSLKEPLAAQIKNYQKVIDSFITQIFNSKIENFTKNKVYGKNNIILRDDIDRQTLTKMLDVIENYSVWDQIEQNSDDEKRIKISIDDHRTYMSKRIENNSKITEVSVVGASTSDYNTMRTALNVFEYILKNTKKGE